MGYVAHRKIENKFHVFSFLFNKNYVSTKVSTYVHDRNARAQIYITLFYRIIVILIKNSSVTTTVVEYASKATTAHN